MSPAGFELAFEGLVVGHGSRRVAGPLDGRWRPGRLLALTGPNGAGKSTLLRTLIGLLPALDGRIDRPDGRAVSYVPQISGLDDAFPVTAGEVVGTGLAIGLSRRERRRRAGDALARFGLGDLARRPFFRLSGGQRQRVLMARALCADAEIIALDEPTAGVDEVAAEGVWRAARELADLGRLVVVVTHDLFRAPRFAHAVLTLAHGALTVQGRDEA